MASTFPALLSFSFPAIFILRVTVGIFFLLFGSRLLQATKGVYTKDRFVRGIGYLYGFSKLAVGVLLLLGVFTQITALLGMGLSALTFLQEPASQSRSSAKQVQILLFILCFALLFLGPGYLSFDLPL